MPEDEVAGFVRTMEAAQGTLETLFMAFGLLTFVGIVIAGTVQYFCNRRDRRRSQ